MEPIMGLNFTSLLREADIDPAQVRLLRHQTTLPNGLTPFELFDRDRDRALFDEYQSYQKHARRSWFNGRYWSTFVGRRNGSTMFTGLYRVGDPQTPSTANMEIIGDETKLMQCPYCSSTQIRKASAVYEEGTSVIKTRTRGVGIGAGRAGLGVGGFVGRSRGQSSSLTAQRADKARITWIRPKYGLALFVLLCVAFAAIHINDPFTKALFVILALMIACPLITGMLASRDNRDYERRWHCDSCGKLWTLPLAADGLG